MHTNLHSFVFLLFTDYSVCVGKETALSYQRLLHAKAFQLALCAVRKDMAPSLLFSANRFETSSSVPGNETSTGSDEERENESFPLGPSHGCRLFHPVIT